MGDTQERIRVAFDATAHDLVAVVLAARARAPAARRDARLILLTAALAAGATLVRIAPDGWLTGLGYAAFAAGIVLGVGAVRRAGDRQRIKAECRARLKGEDWFRVEVEVGPEGVWVRSLGEDVAVGWADVTGVETNGDPVDIWVRGPGLIRVQDRAFGSGMERERFVGLVERYTGARAG